MMASESLQQVPLSLALFDHIPSQTTTNDKLALLALHRAIRRRTRNNFIYLEIGSHLGGSLQALVVDPACRKIISIDPRPRLFKDERGLDLKYDENSTERMLALLRPIPGADVGKIETIERDTDAIDADAFHLRPHYCFIDGEHTDAAALRDARFCLRAAEQDACIAFHDANIVYNAISAFLIELTELQRQFRAYVLPDAVFVVELGSCYLSEEEPLKSLKAQHYQAYLFALESNDWYRAVLNKPLFRKLRRARFVRRLFIVPGRETQGV